MYLSLSLSLFLSLHTLFHYSLFLHSLSLSLILSLDTLPLSLYTLAHYSLSLNGILRSLSGGHSVNPLRAVSSVVEDTKRKR